MAFAECMEIRYMLLHLSSVKNESCQTSVAIKSKTIHFTNRCAKQPTHLGEKPGQIRKKRTHLLPKSASSSPLPMQEPVTLLRLIRQKQWLSQARPHLQPQPCLRTPGLEGQWR